VFGKVNPKRELGLAAAFRTRAIPSLIVVRDGVHLATVSSAGSATARGDLIERVRAIDMEEVQGDLNARAGRSALSLPREQAKNPSTKGRAPSRNSTPIAGRTR
jgi:thioredoxin-like negative regulator of GroEL